MNFLTSIDISILNFIRENLTNHFLDMIMTTITKLGDGGNIWIILTIFFLVKKEYRSLGKILLIAIITNAIVVNLILKPLVGRIRPFDLVSGIRIIINKPRDFSFPSGHTSISFAFLTVILFFVRSKKFKIFSAILAILMAFSRLYLYVHYPSDVIAGAIIGYLCGLFAKKVYEKNLFKSFFDKKIE
ncbi:MAG: phosphatase PAP2 family protein [Peptoniphilaceae bacterium]|nr:phosphatase PAP2 family protein [Peptoniphilaceae bacterium]MDY6018593.1 phosphatase PAP2 family protein [Anaerococcus sp.]